MKRILITSAAALLVVMSTPVSGDPQDLPDIGSPSDAVLSRDREAQVGRMVVRQLREARMIIEDPEINEYIQTVGHRLVAHAHDGEHKFQFFVVDDARINAFALPGGYIGVNYGLILATENESELAGVLAHEIAHVTQRHISRGVQSSQRTSLMTAAAMVAAILVGAATGSSDVIQAGIMTAQGLAAQSMISFTRTNEYEADRVGIGILAAGGFDPEGMPAFFATLARRHGGVAGRIPELLRTHPVESSRIAETRSRVRQLPARSVEHDINYELTKSRIRVVTNPSATDALNYFTRVRSVAADPDSMDLRYGTALAMLGQNRADQAQRLFEELLEEDENTIAFHIGYARALMTSGKTDLGLEAFAEATELFPRNVAVTIAHAEALISVGRAEHAHRILLDLLNNVPPTPEQARLIARAASEAGETGEAHYYMSEYHVLKGELPLAVDQLRLALEVPGLREVQRARFRARMDFITANMSKRARRELEREGSDSPSG